jgi:hypothetical protein
MLTTPSSSPAASFLYLKHRIVVTDEAEKFTSALEHWPVHGELIAA